MMQKRILKAILLVLSIGVLFSSCSSDDEWVAGEILKGVKMVSGDQGFYGVIPLDANYDIRTKRNAEILNFDFLRGYVEVGTSVNIRDVYLDLIINNQIASTLQLAPQREGTNLIYEDRGVQDFLFDVTEALYAKGFTDVTVGARAPYIDESMTVTLHLDLNVLQRNW